METDTFTPATDLFLEITALILLHSAFSDVTHKSLLRYSLLSELHAL